MPRERKSRIWWRNGRAWGDFRDYADVGGGREPLVPEGSKYATDDADLATKIASDRLEDLKARRQNRAFLGIEETARLEAFAAYHLREKAKTGKFSERWLATMQRHFEEAVAFFGAERELTAITARDVQGFVARLAALPGRKGTKEAPQSVEPGTQRAYLNSLSNLYRRAQAEGYVLPGYNPVAALVDKPSPRRREAEWLEVPEAALLLEAARAFKPKPKEIRPGRGGNLPPAEPRMPYRHAYPLLATFLLTGGRRSEVFGLELDDISFDRRTVTFRPNSWRGLKSRSAHRVVPMWPQLEEVLRTYVFAGSGPRGRLLFPSDRGEGERMLTNIDATMREIVERAQIPPEAGHLHALRHTYCAARLQTIDNGVPVAEFTVAREMGHGGHSLVRRIYGHLGTVRHRSGVVEYRIEQHAEKLAARLGALRGA